MVTQKKVPVSSESACRGYRSLSVGGGIQGFREVGGANAKQLAAAHTNSDERSEKRILRSDCFGRRASGSMRMSLVDNYIAAMVGVCGRTGQLEISFLYPAASERTGAQAPRPDSLNAMQSGGCGSKECSREALGSLSLWKPSLVAPRCVFSDLTVHLIFLGLIGQAFGCVDCDTHFQPHSRDWVHHDWSNR